MRVCPTDAIRVRDGKAHVKSRAVHRLRVVPDGLHAEARSRRPRGHSRCSTATPSRWPSPRRYCTGTSRSTCVPSTSSTGLLAAGFDAVWDYGVEIRLVATRHRRLHGPLATGRCPSSPSRAPVVVRLCRSATPACWSSDPRPSATRGRGPRGQAALRAGARPGSGPDRRHLRDAVPGAHHLDHAARRGRAELPGRLVGIPQLYNDVLPRPARSRPAARAASDRAPRALGGRAQMATRRPLTELLKHYRYLSVPACPT